MLAPYIGSPRTSHEAYMRIKALAAATGKTQYQLARENGFTNCYDYQRSIMNEIEMEEGMKKYLESINRCDQEEEDLH